MGKTAQKLTNIIDRLHFPNFLKRSQTAQVFLAGHIRPAGRVYATVGLVNDYLKNLVHESNILYLHNYEKEENLEEILWF